MIGITRRLVFCFLGIEFFLCSAETIKKPHGTALFGDPCERDYHCIENAFCRGQSICQCEQHYSPNPEKTACLATAGLSCEDDSTCATMSNGVCRQNVCSCKDEFTLDINNSSNCIKRPSREGDACQRRDECEEAMERAICIDNKCRCFTSLHFVNETGKCIQTRSNNCFTFAIRMNTLCTGDFLSNDLYNSCNKDYECYLDGKPNVLQCKNNECVCRDNDLRCNTGTFVAATIGLIVSTLILARTA